MKKKLMKMLDVFVIFAFSIYVLLDTFVIPRSYQTVAEETTAETETSLPSETLTTLESTDAVITDTSYSDENMTITIETYRYNDTTVYAADVQLSSLDALKTAFANSTYGKNVTAKTSVTAEAVNAILAINGDYYGARNSGYVIRNGRAVQGVLQLLMIREDLVIYDDGSFAIVTEGSVTAEELLNNGALQVFSFGPGLIIDGEIAVTEDEEVGQAMASSPRTAIAEIEPLHYLFVVADGRTDESEGLSLYELAEFLETLGVKTAYNLDGGGSSTMVFNGTVINNPTTTGSISERKVSDIVYIAG